MKVLTPDQNAVNQDVFASLKRFKLGVCYWWTNQMAHLLCRLRCARRHQSGVIARSSALQNRDAASKLLRCWSEALSSVISTVQVHHAQVSEPLCCPLYSCSTLLLRHCPVERTAQNSLLWQLHNHWKRFQTFWCKLRCFLGVFVCKCSGVDAARVCQCWKMVGF